MAGNSKDGEDVNENTSIESTETEMKSAKKKKKGWFSRIFSALFRSHRDDFEKRLEHISKEEAAVLARIRKRAQNWRRIIRNFILLAVLLEVVAVVYAIMTTRTLEMHWKIRAFKVLPMFFLPGLSFVTYSALSSLNSMFVRKDEKTLERLRSERQAKINELKEKTNYYITQQLIQRYDPDPAAKAAAASVLASKLGADSGLKVYLGDDSQSTAPTGKSADIEVVPSNGLRNRKKGQARPSSTDSTVSHPHEDEPQHQTAPGGTDISPYQQLVVEHHPQTGANASDGGWLARIAALLVGEDPTQSYALICGNCHMHNGLARKEDFPYITYYCPHCNALNRPKELDQRISELNSPHLSTSTTATDVDSVKTPGGSVGFEPSAPSAPSANSTAIGAASTTETGQVISNEQAS